MFLLAIFGWNDLQAEIIIYPVPNGIYYARHNDDYTVLVRQAGDKEWIDLYEYNVKVDMDTKSDATMVQFDFSGKVDILVRKNNGEIRSAVIRPLSKGIKPEIDGNYLLFTIDKPQKLSIEFNGDRLNNLHLFANPIIKDVPDRNDPNVIYFESGIHEPTDKEGKCFRIPSNSTVYLEGGAVLKGCLNCDSVEKVYHFCGLYLNNRDVAEDVVQEVFIKVWESREFIREDDNFKGLLFVITRNLIFNQHRKNVNEDFYKMTVLSAMETSYDLEEEITAYNLGEYIDHLIEELPERRRVIFNLSRKEHKSYKEIAFQLNISEKTVENQISEALKFLKKNIMLLIWFI